LQIAEEVIDEESQVNVGPSSQYVEVRSEVPGDRLQARSQGSSNQLKLSVGGEEDSPEEDDINQLRQSMHMWHLHEQESEEFVEEVFSEKGPKSHNGYLFGAKIGEGSYAKVKEVVDETTLVRRAVKIIKHSRLRKIQNGQENVERELRILNKVKHENVIRLIE
ncbi:hypothetical protein ANCDUO_26680, partial [Ancylostoma duodenale]